MTSRSPMRPAKVGQMSLRLRVAVCAVFLLQACRVSVTTERVTAADQGWSAPRIVEHPVDAVVARGQPVTLNCRAAGHPAPRIVWLQDGGAVTGERPDRLVLAPGSLFFLAARERDAGVYRCRAESAAGQEDSRNATLTVASLRDEFRRFPRPTKATQGSDAVLRCDPPRGHPEVTVQWLKNGDVLTMNDRLRLDRADLHIAGVRLSDAGDYTCQASNVLGVRRSRPAELTVLVSPYFVLRPSPGVGLAGGSLLLPCRVGGSPQPRVHWRRMDGALPVGRLHYTEDNSMRIDALRPSDGGQYSCEAENEAGRISAPVTVTIHVSPSVDAPAQKLVHLGSPAALKCQVRGHPVPRGVWWKEAEFDPLLADQERGRITTSIQNDLYISPVTSADLGWWVCAATNAAGSVVSRVLLHTGSRSSGDEVKVAATDSIHSELVHLEEVKVTGQHSVRLAWKTSDRRPVDGFYICYILLPPPDGEASPASPGSLGSPAAPAMSEDSPAGRSLHRVTVLNGGAESYELTGLRAGAAYQLFLVPFRAGREGRLSRLREVRLPEAVPSAAPGNLSVIFTKSETVITWSPLSPDVTNGRITGYSVTVKSGEEATMASASAAVSSPAVPPVPTPAAGVAEAERTYHVSQRKLVLAGRRGSLRVRVAAVTAAGRGPFSPWWRAGVDAEAGKDDNGSGGSGSGSGDGGRDGGGGGGGSNHDGIRSNHDSEEDVTGPPLTVTATIPRHSTSPHLPTWLVAVLCCLGFFTLSAGVLALHCHRLRKKQNVLAGHTPAELADSKPPPSVHSFPSASLSQNTLWLRDELFTKNGSFPNIERDVRDSRDVRDIRDIRDVRDAVRDIRDTREETRHLYVNGLSEPAVAVGLYASARVVGSPRCEQVPDSPRLGLNRSLGSARMARRLHSLGIQSARSSPGVSAAPHSQPASPRLRHDRHRAPHSSLYGSGSFQECCCYECDYGRASRPPPLPPESPDVCRSSCDGLCDCELGRPAARRRRPRLRSNCSGGSGSTTAPERCSERCSELSGRGSDRCIERGDRCSERGERGTERGTQPSPPPSAPYAAGESSISAASSSSSLYAETDLNEMLGATGELAELTSELGAELGEGFGEELTQPPQLVHQQTRPPPGLGDRHPASRTHSLCSADSAYGTPGPSRHSFSNGDGGRPNCSFTAAPTDVRSGAKPGRRRRSGGGSSEHVAYSAT